MVRGLAHCTKTVQTLVLNAVLSQPLAPPSRYQRPGRFFLRLLILSCQRDLTNGAHDFTSAPTLPSDMAHTCSIRP